MAVVSSIGIGSGIDISSIVTQLVAAEGQPVFNAIAKKENAVNTRLSGLGTLKSALSDFQSAVKLLKDGDLFKAHLAKSSNENALGVSASASAAAGGYTVDIVSLAKAQKTASAVGVAMKSDTVGKGQLTLTLSGTPSSTFTVDVTDSNNTLEKLRDSINQNSANNFVTASIVNVANGSGGTVAKLMLTAKNTGSAGAFTVAANDQGNTTPAGALLSQLFPSGLTNTVDAANAEIKVDGLTAYPASNTVTDVVQGVTMNLLPGSEGKTVNVDVSVDTTAIKKTLNDFVTAYNKLRTTAKTLGAYGGSTDGSGSGNGALIGDSTLRYVTSQLRQDTTSTVSSTTSLYNSLAMIGIKVDKDGVMSMDSTQLNTALTSDLQSVSDVFASSGGVANRLNSKLDQFLQSGGPLDSQQTSLKNRLTALTNQRATEQLHLDQLQKTYQKQFTAMDVAVGQFKSTGAFLSNWISKL